MSASSAVLRWRMRCDTEAPQVGGDDRQVSDHTQHTRPCKGQANGFLMFYSCTLRKYFGCPHCHNDATLCTWVKALNTVYCDIIARKPTGVPRK
eukprot:843815-Amphidinium_carterae.1